MSMKKKMNLVELISAKMNRNQFTDSHRQLIDETRTMMQESGIETRGSIFYPLETRTISASTIGYGAECISTQTTDILSPLRNKLTLAKAGATILTN